MLLATTMFLSLLVAPAPAEEPIVLDLGTEPAVEQTVDFSSEDLQPAPDPGMQPAAICRLIPECDSKADCEAICGTTTAKCVHSRCPIRVCRC